MIPRLREGAQLKLAHAAYEIAASAQALDNDAPPHEDRRKMQLLWALLDAIGWTGAAPDSIELDTDKHSLALLIAAGEIEPQLHEVLSEMSDDDERKGARTYEFATVQEFDAAARHAIARIERTVPDGALAVPSALVDRIREGAYGLLATAGEAIMLASHAHEQPESVSRDHLERAWALLGRLGWTADGNTGEAIEIGIAEHGVTLHAAIETMIPLLTGRLDDIDPSDPSQPDRADELRLIRQFAARTRRAITEE